MVEGKGVFHVSIQPIFSGGTIEVIKKNVDQLKITVDCPIYVTTNLLPHFRHAASIMTRLDRFDTKSLSVRTPGVGAHFRSHAMEHLHWIALQIDMNRHMIKAQELFYELNVDEEPSRLERARQEEITKIKTSTHIIVPGISSPYDENAVPEVFLHFCFSLPKNAEKGKYIAVHVFIF